MWRPRSAIPVGAWVLRKLTVVDAEAQRDAVLESLPVLVPHMPWAQFEPTTVEERRELLTSWDAEWWAGDNFNYGIFEGDALVGGTGLMRRLGPAILEIGYWVHIDHHGRGIATEVSRALTTEAFTAAWCARVAIRHDVANEGSRRIPEKLGFELVETHPDEATSPGDAGPMCVWLMRRDAWAQ